jgi:outer membrane receptor protein involved in Fe transport
VLYPSPTNPNAAIALQPVGQEHINHFELGSKGTYLDRTLMLNVDLFDTIYQDYQIQTYAAVANVLTPPLDLTSAGKAETRGVELDTQWAAPPILMPSSRTIRMRRAGASRAVSFSPRRRAARRW